MEEWHQRQSKREVNRGNLVQKGPIYQKWSDKLTQIKDWTFGIENHQIASWSWGKRQKNKKIVRG